MFKPADRCSLERFQSCRRERVCVGGEPLRIYETVSLPRCLWLGNHVSQSDRNPQLFKLPTNQTTRWFHWLTHSPTRQDELISEISCRCVCVWRENLCADSVVAVIFYVNPADKWTVSLRVWCNVFSQSCRGCWSSRGLTNAAARRPPSRRRRRLSSCYLRCPWIRERISFLLLPSCPASYSRHARECVCVCVASRHTHTHT